METYPLAPNPVFWTMAWSFNARRMQRPALPQCEGGGHKNCANCLPYALHWRERMIARAEDFG